MITPPAQSTRLSSPGRGAALVSVAAILGAGLVCGCAGQKASRAGAVSSQASRSKVLASPQTSGKYNDPVAVSQLRERALDVLAKMATDPNAQLRGNAIEAMSATPNRLEAYLPQALRDENLGVRATAATMIGKLKLGGLAPATRPLLNDPSPFVRASAMYAIARCGQPVDQSPLGSLILSDPSPRVRAHVAYLLGELGDGSAVGLLHDAAKEPMPRASAAEYRMLQIQICEALVKLGDEGQLPAIRAALYPSRAEDLEIVALAVQILGQLKDKGSIDELIYLTARKNESDKQYWPAEIRLGAAGALARMGLDQGTFLADEYATNPTPVLRAQAAHVYGDIGRAENLGKLEAMLADPDSLVRLSAAAAILQIGPRSTSQASR